MTASNHESTPSTAATGPLVGLKILELGHFVAAPFATRLLADLGADVIKIEPPGGDPVRQWGEQANGQSPWWSMHARNKRCLSLDLKHPGARSVVLRLAGSADALVENFRPGQLDRLGLGEAVLREARPNLVIARISGFGQDGPYRDRASFGVIGEAMGGLRYLTNHPPEETELPPSRVGISIGDSIAGLYAAFGVMAALWQRDRAGGAPGPFTLDVALTEAMLSMMEGTLPEYGVFGTVRQPQGSRIKTAAPTNAYPTRDGKWLLIAANSDPLFRRFARTIGRPELADDPDFAGNPGRLRHVERLDGIIADWSRGFDAAEADRILREADIPSTLCFNAAEIAGDEQYRARGMVREVEDPLIGKVLQAGIVPHVPEAPGTVRWTGPAIGAHTDEVLGEVGFGASEIQELREQGVVR